ncbi:MAG: phosphoribosylaminoimidazolesuccinocarboxamide synthase [Phycisphaerales bacterium]|nr:phosphoribosylaminoimidazolesuccinocarboxamide synthase [Phycisphaerales bacterium]
MTTRPSEADLGTRAPLLRSALPFPRREGKVRDIYDLPDGCLLIVASDRISAFDVVMPTPIPGKGEILTRLACFWLRWIEAKGLSGTHLLSDDAADIPGVPPEANATLRGRVMLARRCRVVPIECVVRGYLEGSGWKEYQATGAVCGVRLPAGLRQCDRLPEPIFTPATKEEVGTHDENVSFEQASARVGEPLMRRLREVSLAIYRAAAAHALARGIIIADTKFEFGIPEGGSDPILIDEALTPDSSRFWPAADYAPGRAQRSFDKQFVREFLEDLVRRGVWNKTPPGPDLPDEVVRGTLERYRAAAQGLMD